MKKMISVLFAIIFAFLLVAEEVIPAQAANDTNYYNIQFLIIDTQNNIQNFYAPNVGIRSPQPYHGKYNGTGQVGPYISNMTVAGGIPQTIEFTVTGICYEVAATSNSTAVVFEVHGNQVITKIMWPEITGGTTIDIVISGKHEPIPNSIDTQPATCTTKGQETAICSKCNQQYVSRILPVDPNRHEKGIKIIDKDATCTEDGQYHYECEKCGAELSKKQTITAKGHTWTDSGSGLVCSVCGKKSEAKASGMYYGIPWEMDAEGNLTLNGGTCTNTCRTTWKAADVKTVKCNGEIICNSLFCTRLFTSHSNLVSADLSGFNTSNVTDMSSMFYKCSSLTSLNVSNFNTSNVTTMGAMFSYCSSLTSLDLSNFNTSKVTDMNGMFYGCSALTSLNISNFDTSNVTNMSSMFGSFGALTSLDLSNFNTSNVTNMCGMFENSCSLTSLDLSSFDTSNVKYAAAMFYNCNSLTSLDLSSFDGSKLSTANMLANCPNLEVIKTFKILPTKKTNFILFTNTMYTSDGTAHTTMDVANATLIKTKHIHSYDDRIIIKQATPYNTGIIQKTCSCGDTYTEEIPQLKFNIFVDKTTRIKGIAKGNVLLFNNSSENAPFIIN